MKKLFLILAFIVSMTTAGFSQETVIYTFFVNIVPEQFQYPLVGCVNIAKGDHDVVQLGFVNWNKKDFTSLQAGFVNTIGGNLSGAQFGFVNSSIGDINGLQSGFVNTVKDGVQGFQLGFVNTSFGDINGWQIGYVNTAQNSVQGFQLGFVNTTMKKLTGFQLGFINYADSIAGIPIGFLSIVRNGGYHVVEYSFSEFYHINIGLKLGVEKFYTTFFVAYNPTEGFVSESFATGLGIGSIFPITTSLFFNPELNNLTTSWGKSNQQLLSFVPYLGHNITKNISVLVAPSLTWIHNNDAWLHSNGDDELKKPFFKIVSHEINDNNSLVVGARANVRVRF